MEAGRNDAGGTASKAPKSKPAGRPVAAAERALLILDAFAARQQSLTLGEIAEATGLFKSVILRYLISFEAMSYLRRRPGGRYQLDIKALQLGRAFENTFDAREAINATLVRLRDESGESGFFYVREGESRVCVMGADSPQSLRVSRKIGAPIPLDSTSISEVLREFAHGAPDGRQVDASMVRRSIGEHDVLTASVSAPVFDRDGALMGALTVSGPIGRFDAGSESIVAMVGTHARRLSEEVGHVGARS
jgi:DNA-binding IclR family transcriptional regulator